MPSVEPFPMHTISPDLTPPRRESWMDDARCKEVDPGLFHPDTRNSQAYRVRSEQAISVCRNCEVKAECLEWALETDDRYGVLGGTTPGQRARMRRSA